MIQDRYIGKTVKDAIQSQVKVINSNAANLNMHPVDLAAASLEGQKDKMIAYMNLHGIKPIDPNSVYSLATQITTYIAQNVNLIKTEYADNGMSDFLGSDHGPLSNTDSFDEYAGQQFRTNDERLKRNSYGLYNNDDDTDLWDEWTGDYGDQFSTSGGIGDQPPPGSDGDMFSTNGGVGDQPPPPDNSDGNNGNETTTSFAPIGSLIGSILTVGGGILSNYMQGQNLQQQGVNLTKQQQLAKQQGQSANILSGLATKKQQSILLYILMVFGFIILIIALLHHFKETEK